MLHIDKETGEHVDSDRLRGLIRTIMAVTIFSVAMAAIESAVVVYLRALYYGDGFTVAFKLIDKHIVYVELMRELGTLIMLSVIGYLAGTNARQRFAFFLLSFAIWDISYYGWLKIFIDWPTSVFEWDILFLIPFTWLGPVLSPVICSLTMIGLAFALIHGSTGRVAVSSVILISLGSLLILYTYLADYGNLLLTNGLMSDYANLLSNDKFIRMASAFLPTSYNWTLFWLGDFLIWTGIALLLPLPSAWQSVMMKGPGRITKSTST